MGKAKNATLTERLLLGNGHARRFAAGAIAPIEDLLTGENVPDFTEGVFKSLLMRTKLAKEVGMKRVKVKSRKVHPELLKVRKRGKAYAAGNITSTFVMSAATTLIPGIALTALATKITYDGLSGIAQKWKLCSA